MVLSYEQARGAIVRELGLLAHTGSLRRESIALKDALGRVLAEDIRADRPYPPFDRSIRDGFPVRAVDVAPGAKLKRIGELKAGDTPRLEVTPGTCIQIMTGAAVPRGADTVDMIEHTHVDGDTVVCDRAIAPCQHIVKRGA